MMDFKTSEIKSNNNRQRTIEISGMSHEDQALIDFLLCGRHFLDVYGRFWLSKQRLVQVVTVSRFLIGQTFPKGLFPNQFPLFQEIPLLLDCFLFLVPPPLVDL